MTHSPPPASEDRRHAARGTPDRRRAQWHAFREAYPTFLKVASLLFLVLVAGDMWLGYRRVAYANEIARLRAGMTSAERRRSDAIVQSEQNKLRMAYELARRQARVDPQLHLSIEVDSGRMYLQRNGALLRDMRVVVAPATIPGVPATDTAARTLPRGERMIASIDSGAAPALVLNGGTRIYAPADSARVTPGDVAARRADLIAILPNLSAGTPVYFY